MQPDQTSLTPAEQPLDNKKLPEKPVPTVEKQTVVQPTASAQSVQATNNMQANSAATTNQQTSAQPSGQQATIDPSLAQLSAQDVDTIEKVWVDKSDQIIETKKDDPKAEDEAQHNLSRAYLKKRFNLDVD